MEFWASAEVHQPAFSALDKARRCVGPFLNRAFAASSLAALQVELRYVRIVMPKNLQSRYPARSKLRKRQRIYDCAPVLITTCLSAGYSKNNFENTCGA